MLQDNEEAGPSNINLEEDSSDYLRWNIIDESLESTRSCSTILDSSTLAEDPLNLEAKNSHCVIHINKNIPKTETKTLKLFTQSTLEKCKLMTEVRLKMTLKHSFEIRKQPYEIHVIILVAIEYILPLKKNDITKYKSLLIPELVYQPTNENTKEFNKHIVTRQGVVAPSKSETTGVFKNTCIFLQ